MTIELLGGAATEGFRDSRRLKSVKTVKKKQDVNVNSPKGTDVPVKKKSTAILCIFKLHVN